MSRYAAEESETKPCPQRSFARYWHTSAKKNCPTPTTVGKDFSPLAASASPGEDPRVLLDLPPRPRSCAPILLPKRSQASTPRRRCDTRDTSTSCGSPTFAFATESQYSASAPSTPANNARGSNRREKSQVSRLESPLPSAPSSPANKARQTPLPESPNVQARRQRQEMMQVLEDFSLWHNWLRLVLDGFEAAIEILRVRCEGIVETHTATVFDVMRAASAFQKQMINGFTDLKGQSDEDVNRRSILIDDDAYPSMTSRPLNRSQAHAIDVLQSFVASLERMPHGASVLEAAVEIVQIGGRLGKTQGLTTAPSSLQHVIVKLREVQQDLFSGFAGLREHMQDMVMKTGECSEASSWLYPSEDEADEVPTSVAEDEPKSEEQQSREQDEETEIAEREASATSKSCSALASRRLKDPKCAALWGVTFQQLLTLHVEMSAELEQYSATHKAISRKSGFAHVCLDEDHCKCSHGEFCFISAQELTDEEALDMEIIENDMHLAADIIIKPRTKSSACSWALMTNPGGMKVDVFVTHAWHQHVDELFQTLEMSLTPDNALWLSILSLNLHDDGASVANFSDITKSAFYIALKSATRQVVLVDSSMSLPHRAWCMFEILQAAACEVDTSYWFADLQQLDALALDATVFDMKDAVSFVSADSDLIMDWMEGTDGFDMLNMRLRKYFAGFLSLYRNLNRLGAGVPSLEVKQTTSATHQLTVLREELQKLRESQAQLQLQMLQSKSSPDGEMKRNIKADVFVANGSITIVLELIARLEKAVKNNEIKLLHANKESDGQAMQELKAKIEKQAEEAVILQKKAAEAEQEYIASQDQLAQTQEELANLKDFVESQQQKPSRRGSARSSFVG